MSAVDEVRDERLSTYAEVIALLEALPVLCREKRRRLGMSLRGASEASGVSFNAIKRIEDGTSDPAWTSAVALLRWIGLPDQHSTSLGAPADSCGAQ